MSRRDEMRAPAPATVLDAPRGVELVAPAGHDHDRNLGRERLLGDTHAPVETTHAARLRIASWGRKRTTRLPAGAWNSSVSVSGARANHGDAGRGERFQRDVQQALVALALGRAGDEHQRLAHVGHPCRRRRAGGAQSIAPTRPHVRRPIPARVLEPFGGQRE